MTADKIAELLIQREDIDTLSRFRHADYLYQKRLIYKAMGPYHENVGPTLVNEVVEIIAEEIPANKVYTVLITKTVEYEVKVETYGGIDKNTILHMALEQDVPENSEIIVNSEAEIIDGDFV